jgi:hypothetical protein
MAFHIVPFLGQHYRDEGAEDLASFTAWQHVRSHGGINTVTWQRPVGHIAATGCEPRTAEFELQDFIVDVIVVKYHRWSRTSVGATSMISD